MPGPFNRALLRSIPSMRIWLSSVSHSITTFLARRCDSSRSSSRSVCEYVALKLLRRRFRVGAPGHAEMGSEMVLHRYSSPSPSPLFSELFDLRLIAPMRSITMRPCDSRSSIRSAVISPTSSDAIEIVKLVCFGVRR
jgi:hypothetical protein